MILIFTKIQGVYNISELGSVNLNIITNVVRFVSTFISPRDRLYLIIKQYFGFVISYPNNFEKSSKKIV